MQSHNQAIPAGRENDKKEKAARMVLVTIAWMYVVLMVVVVEATSPQGTLLGALFTLLLYGLLPLGIVLYLMRSPARRRNRRAAEAGESAVAAPLDPDRGRHAPGDAVAPERKEP
jgi:predicted membrane channel-forming protein YqfA (hemolysin III family)